MKSGTSFLIQAFLLTLFTSSVACANVNLTVPSANNKIVKLDPATEEKIAPTINEEAIKNFREATDKMIKEIEKFYVESISDKKKIEDSALNGLLSALDPHSGYFDKKQLDELLTSTKGEFEGLGIEITKDQASGFIKVVSPIDDTPAFKAGIKPGDFIVKISGVPTNDMDLTTAVSMMRGKKGTSVHLTIAGKSNTGLKGVDITRNTITIQSVKHYTINDIAVVRITNFNTQVTDQFIDEFKKARAKIVEYHKAKLKQYNSLKETAKQNNDTDDYLLQSLDKKIKEKSDVVDTAKKNSNFLNSEESGVVKGLVIDLRNNPGGTLMQAIDVSDLFLKKSVIVSNRYNGVTREYNADEKTIINNDIPIVVLINEGSASASEIVAGALKDNKRAVIVGRKSFGKGTVQNIIELPNQEGALKVTIARYYTPNGTSIQATGILPDVIVEEDLKLEISSSENSAIDKLKNEDLSISEKDLQNHVKNNSINFSNLDDSSWDISIDNKESKKNVLNDKELRAAINTINALSALKKTQ